MKIDTAKLQNQLNVNGLGQTQPAPVTKLRQGGPSFQETLSNLQQPTIDKTKVADPLAGVSAVKFSNHAIDRMMSRGIHFSPDDMVRINDAVNKAAAKGSKDSLLLMDDSALIVSVKNKTVVTVMDKASMKENVFTNIDSTIVM